jgi:hypothetical protein
MLAKDNRVIVSKNMLFISSGARLSMSNDARHPRTPYAQLCAAWHASAKKTQQTLCSEF